MEDFDEIEAAALALPEDLREVLAWRLMTSLPYEASDEEVSDAWMREVDRRLAAIRSGDAELIPFELVMAELRAELGFRERSGGEAVS